MIFMQLFPLKNIYCDMSVILQCALKFNSILTSIIWENCFQKHKQSILVKNKENKSKLPAPVHENILIESK
jgi:hypothetical protein